MKINRHFLIHTVWQTIVSISQLFDYLSIESYDVICALLCICIISYFTDSACTFCNIFLFKRQIESQIYFQISSICSFPVVLFRCVFPLGFGSKWSLCWFEVCVHQKKIAQTTHKRVRTVTH